MNEILNAARVIKQKNTEAAQTTTLEEQKRQEELLEKRAIGSERAAQFVELMRKYKVPMDTLYEITCIRHIYNKKDVLPKGSYGYEGGHIGDAYTYDREPVIQCWIVRDYEYEYEEGATPGLAILENSMVVLWNEVKYKNTSEKIASITHKEDGGRCLTNVSERLYGDRGLEVLGQAAVKFGIVK